MRLAVGFPPRRLGFDSGSSNVGFVVDKMSVGEIFSKYFGFPRQFSFQQMFHTYHPWLVQQAN
jgi:hypothetical protein